MSTEDRDFSSRAAVLRSEFDASFARVAKSSPPVEDFLAVRVGDAAYAIRLSEVAGVHRDRKITRVTSHAAHLLGVAAFRGTSTPIYDLREILGYSAPSASRWLLLAQSPLPIGFAFDGLDGHVRIEAGSGALEVDGSEKRFVHGALRTNGRSLFVLRLAPVIEAITQNRI